MTGKIFQNLCLEEMITSATINGPLNTNRSLRRLLGPTRKIICSERWSERGARDNGRR